VEKKPIEIAFTVAREVVHAYKEHKINDYKNNGIDKNIKREKEADKLAVKWLSKHYKRESLLKLCKSTLLEKKIKTKNEF